MSTPRNEALSPAFQAFFNMIRESADFQGAQQNIAFFLFHPATLLMNLPQQRELNIGDFSERRGEVDARFILWASQFFIDQLAAALEPQDNDSLEYGALFNTTEDRQAAQELIQIYIQMQTLISSEIPDLESIKNLQELFKTSQRFVHFFTKTDNKSSREFLLAKTGIQELKYQHPQAALKICKNFLFAIGIREREQSRFRIEFLASLHKEGQQGKGGMVFEFSHHYNLFDVYAACVIAENLPTFMLNSEGKILNNLDVNQDVEKANALFDHFKQHQQEIVQKVLAIFDAEVPKESSQEKKEANN